MTHRGFGFVNLEGRARTSTSTANPARRRAAPRSGGRGDPRATAGAPRDHRRRPGARHRHLRRHLPRGGSRARIVHPQDTRLPEHVIVEKPGNAQDGDLVAAEFSATPITPTGPRAGSSASSAGMTWRARRPTWWSHDLASGRFPSAAEAEAASLPDRIPRRRSRADSICAAAPDHRRSRERSATSTTRCMSSRCRRAGASLPSPMCPGTSRPMAPWTEASARGFSVYLPDRVIPMLPHRLSSDLCSLRPEEDRLAMVVECTITLEGEIEDAGSSPRRSFGHARFTYDRAARMLGMMGAPPAADDSPDFEALRPVLEALRDATRGCAAAAAASAATWTWPCPSRRVFFATDGGIDDVRASDRHEAHQMIEDAMLVANEATAELFVRRHQASIFRIHGNPPVDGLRAPAGAGPCWMCPSRAWAGRRPMACPGGSPGSRRAPALRPAGAPGAAASMAKAVYDEEVAPHFGLGAPAYLHFTSPIRRYPDLVVHRLLKGILRREQLPTTRHLGEVADQCSRRERVAVDAERTVLDLVQGALSAPAHRVLRGRHRGGDGQSSAVHMAPGGGVLLVDALDDDFRPTTTAASACWGDAPATATPSAIGCACGWSRWSCGATAWSWIWRSACPGPGAHEGG
ncbi:MAG: RNB domain-containing ribonuclease [bacterium]